MKLKGNLLRRIGLGLILLGGISFNSIGQNLDTINLQLKWKHQFQFAGYYVAFEKGFYEDKGLYVNIIEAEENTDVIADVMEGKADIGIATSDILIARNKGLPLVVIANIFQHSPYVFLSISHDEGDNIHDLSGKSIMLENHAEELLAYLKTEQIDIDNINFIPHSYSPKELIAGVVFAISAYLTDEPFRLLEQNISYNTFNPRSSGIDFYGDLLFTTEPMVSEQTQVVNKFLKATQKGWDYALRNKEEVIRVIYQKYSQRHSLDHLRFEAEKTERLIMPEVIEIGYINPDRWNRIGEIYADLGMLPVDFSTNGFLYTNNEKPNLTKFYLIILGVLILSFVIMLIAIRFYRLNHKLSVESLERQRLMEEVSAASKFKDRLFSIISHDLKGPIGTLNEFMEILTDEDEDLSEAQQKQVLLKFKGSLSNTYEMLQTLLLWALSQKDEQQFNSQENHMLKLIEKNINLVSVKAENKNIGFEILCEEDKAFLFDADMMDIVVRNLISNSVKYSNENSTVTIQLKISTSELSFSITDKGTGIAEKDLSRLFDFEQQMNSMPGTKGEKGSGLGLVLCKEFIDKHKGRIWANSTIGKGSSFNFTIPSEL